MKLFLLLTALLAGLFISGSCSAQTPKTVKKEITKEINVTEENGQKKLTITSTEDGKSTTETYTGKEAEAKIKELESGEEVTVHIESDEKPADVSRDVLMKEIDGEKVLTVTTTENGKTTTETYKGTEADAKLKELENNPPAAQKGKSVKQSVQVRKIETKEK